MTVPCQLAHLEKLKRVVMKTFPAIIARITVELSRIFHIGLGACAFSLTVLPCLLPSQAISHELQDNRAVLIQREANHLSLTLYLDYLSAMALELSAKTGPDQFVLMSATLSPEYFQRLSASAQAKFEAAVVLRAGNNAPVAFQNWRWPDAQKLQQEARSQIMQAITAGQDHPHSSPVEVTAELFSPNPLSQISIQFPSAFGKVLLVSYRPNQKWLEPGQAGRVEF